MSSLRVRARRRGVYRQQLRRDGDVFTLARGEDFNARWMQPVGEDEPERRATAQAAVDLACAHGVLLAETGRRPRPAGAAEVEGGMLSDFDPYDDPMN